MKLVRLATGATDLLWWLPTIVATVVGWVATEVLAHVHLARACRMYARAERLSSAGRDEEAEVLLDRGNQLVQLATPRPERR